MDFKNVSKRTTAEMNDDEFMAFLIRDQRKTTAFFAGGALLSASITAIFLGMALMPIGVAALAGAIALGYSTFVWMTQAKFVPTIPLSEDFEEDLTQVDSNSVTDE